MVKNMLISVAKRRDEGNPCHESTHTERIVDVSEMAQTPDHEEGDGSVALERKKTEKLDGHEGRTARTKRIVLQC